MEFYRTTLIIFILSSLALGYSIRAITEPKPDPKPAMIAGVTCAMYYDQCFQIGWEEADCMEALLGCMNIWIAEQET